MIRRILLLLIVCLAATAAFAADSPQFRGPARDGLFAESGLLQSWPDKGPRALWTADGLGEGYASVSVAGGRIFTTGKHDGQGHVYAFDLDGKPLWQRNYGPAHEGGGYPGTRTTPTVDGEALYLLSSMGKAMALDVETGAVRWSIDVFERFKGRNLYFGISESPLVVDDKVILTPGGPDATVVALDKTSGETVWTSKGLSEKSAYCNPRLLEHAGRRQIVTLVEKHLVGIDAASGEVLWRTPSSVNYDIHAVSPLFFGNGIFISHGYGQGSHFFTLAADGGSVTETWSHKLDVHHGGAVLLDGRIYGAASKKTWYALDAATGEELASIPRLGKGAVVHADGRLYGYLESGEVVLVDPDPAHFAVVGRFQVEAGEGHHWAHPVVSGGVLYIRHGDALLAFDVKAGS